LDHVSGDANPGDVVLPHLREKQGIGDRSLGLRPWPHAGDIPDQHRHRDQPPEHDGARERRLPLPRHSLFWFPFLPCHLPHPSPFATFTTARPSGARRLPTTIRLETPSKLSANLSARITGYGNSHITQTSSSLCSRFRRKSNGKFSRGKLGGSPAICELSKPQSAGETRTVST